MYIYCGLAQGVRFRVLLDMYVRRLIPILPTKKLKGLFSINNNKVVFDEK